MTQTVRNVRPERKRVRAPCTALRGRKPHMVHERIRRARVEAHFETAADAARAFGWNVNTYTSTENGNRGVTPHKALEYSRAFGVTLDWLMTGRGPMRRKRRMIQVVGHVGAGARLYYEEAGPLDEIEAPPGADEGDRAVRVRGDSLYPRYMDGDVVVFGEATTPGLALGRDCICQLEDGVMLLKRIQPGSQPETYTLASHNEAPILNARVVSAHIVKWHRPS